MLLCTYMYMNVTLLIILMIPSCTIDLQLFVTSKRRTRYMPGSTSGSVADAAETSSVRWSGGLSESGRREVLLLPDNPEAIGVDC